MGIKKAECLPGTTVVVNEKKSKWNEELGTKHNGLLAHDWNPAGNLMIGDQIHEILPGKEIEILAKPRKVQNSGVHVKFKIAGEDKIFTSWWICFLNKVDHL